MFDRSIKIKNFFFVSRKITTVISSKIKSKFEVLAKIFDNTKADLRHSEFNFKALLKDSVKMILNKLFV